MGAWNFFYPRLHKIINKEQTLSFCGRPESASPAVGSAKISEQQQKNIIEKAFNS
jgi:2-oxoglutarate dehydrogenase E1 component